MTIQFPIPVFSSRTYIKGNVLNWVDNMIQWLNKESDCCKVYNYDKNVFCPSSRKDCEFLLELVTGSGS